MSKASTALRFLFEDQHLVVLSKPAGLLSQEDFSEEKSLVQELQLVFGRHYVGLVHRLDRNTTGLMVVAKRTKAAQRLTTALQTGTLTRQYQALLLGHLPQKQSWKHWLLKNEKTNQVAVVAAFTAKAKEAILFVTPLEYSTYQGHPITLAQFTLETGRSHQIRVQSAHQNFPVLGDPKYGPSHLKNLFWRQALHSATLEFPHPMTNELLHFEDPIPDDMRQILSAKS